MDPRHHPALDRRAEAAQFALERADAPDATELIAELEAHLAAHYPAESRHGYSVEKLLREGVAFFVARIDGEAAACGGVQLYGREYGELKRMYVRPRWRRRGLGRRMLERLAAHARGHGVALLRLETGIHQAEAIGLYEAFGFRRRTAFPPYREDPLSLYYELCLPA
jgi:ribosomal protein S18 acetylase RimI-like enzyme